MLKLKSIKKDYVMTDSVVHALKGLDITFRDSEFVSILGPSGCGKTTLLNIIGGLDHYTSGDLEIDGISTKEYNDRNWDTYRNHRVGFIFQSYNLIPHQTILENVELALNIAGVDKNERVKLSKEALDKVGLKDMYNKKPNQLSGGQCQRVAIARALVNEPEILLADEPTGALDTVTSVQIMELIKEISKERLVIMVTHNPELAEKYSTRIVKLLDGEIISDSNPYDETDVKEVKVKKDNTQKSTNKSKLKFWSSFRLSAKNLLSKFKRTLMVCFAGSIGIIGVATVLAVSTGISSYIVSMQDDMLSGNPITISESSLNLSSLLDGMSSLQKLDAVKKSVVDGKVNVNYLLNYLINSQGAMESARVKNNISSSYVNFVHNMPKENYAAIVDYYGIDVTNNIYTTIDLNGKSTQMMSLSAITKTYTAMLEKTTLASYSSYITSLTETFEQAPNNKDYILSQYDIISTNGVVAQNENEIMLVVSKDTELNDLFLAQLGYYNQEQFFNIIYKITNDSRYNAELDKDRFDFDELLGKTFMYYNNDSIYQQNNNSSTSAFYPFTYNNVVDSETQNGIQLKITAILRPKDNVSYGSLEAGFYYTNAFAKKYLQDNKNSKVVTYLSNGENLIDKDTSSMMYAGVKDSSGNFVGQKMISYNLDYYFEVDGTMQNFIEKAIVGRQQSNMLGFMGITNSGSGNSSSTSSTYTLSVRELGGVDNPNKIAIYPINFDLKDKVTDYLDKWNSEEDIVVNDVTLTKQDRGDINYTDNLSVIISMINTMINIVTYALVAFTGLSLIVSTVMVAIITYVSVIERIKEIGVIRSLGGRKKDVSRLFTAETFIIGGISGVLGILVTYILCLVINIVVGSLSGIYTIALLKPVTSIIMIMLSIGLTLISGVIPAKLAAKKDPVEALRSI